MSTQKKHQLSSKMELYIATTGYVYHDCEIGDFYPADLPDSERLKYYSSVFNSITIKSTFFGQPKLDTYKEWLASTSGNKSFKFILTAPRYMSHSKNIKDLKRIWNLFWGGPDGCKIFHQQARLGCILIEFPSCFCFSSKNIGRLKALQKILPNTVKFAFEFRHWSWWEKKETDIVDLFLQNKNWCIVTPYVENSLVESGWAGNLPSTRVNSEKEAIPSVLTSDFTVLNFHGTMGRRLGSYDENSFLEKMVSRIRQYQNNGVNTVFCSFNNTDSSYCFPLPGILIMGIPLRPQINELPKHTQLDLPCCLHDATRFGKLWKEIDEYPFSVDDHGHTEMVFC